MAEQEQVYKSDNEELVSFLLSRGCLVRDKSLRIDNRVDLVVAGPHTLDLLKEWDMGSSNTLVPVHPLFSNLRFLRDIFSRVRRESGRGRD